MKRLVIGIMPQEKIRAHILAIARGEYVPKPDDPKIWFTSIKSLAEVLSDENRALLGIIRDMKPSSITVLAEYTHRAPSNLSRTLKTLSNYGIVELKREGKQVRPVALATDFDIRASADSREAYESDDESVTQALNKGRHRYGNALEKLAKR